MILYKEYYFLNFLGGSRGSTPEQEKESRLGTSPHINRFLAREPPDGCEKVNLKFIEDSRYLRLHIFCFEFSFLKYINYLEDNI